MDHSFNIEVAKELGIAPAVILNNMYWWIEKNKANEKHFHDGYYWTYNSRKAYVLQFPYLTERQIEYALKKLIDEGYIITGNYNKASFDRTLWYAITKKGYCILQNCEMEKTNFVNANTENVGAIPDINTDKKNTDRESIPFSEIIRHLNSKAGTSFRVSSKDTQKHILARWNEGYRLEDFFKVIDAKASEWRYDKKMAPYLRPSTLFGTKFESYLQQYKEPQKKADIDGSDLARNEDGSLVTF